MQLLDTGRLVLLSAIWGASFLFMRIAAPEFGPVPLILLRVGVAALVLLPMLLQVNNRVIFTRHFKKLTVVGLISSALPFSLLAFATIRLEAGFTSLLNATTPIFAALIGLVWLRTPIARAQVLGLVVALSGVTVLSWDRLSFKSGGAGWAIVATLAASACYGMTAHYTRRYFKDVPVKVVVAGSMITATMMLLPMGLWLWPETMPSAQGWFSALILAVICTAFAYMLYFYLLAKTGAVVATAVTFLVPVFAVFWGAWLLKESITLQLIIGMVITLLGTLLTVGLIRFPSRRTRSTQSIPAEPT